MSIQWIAQLIPNIYLQNHTGCDLSIGWRYIQLLYNWRLYFIFINCLSVRLLQAVIFTVIFSPSNQKLYWKGKKSTNKNKHIKQTFYIRLKRLTSAGVSIACKSCFTCACVRSHIIATHSINVTTVRVGRALVDV